MVIVFQGGSSKVLGPYSMWTFNRSFTAGEKIGFFESYTIPYYSTHETIYVANGSPSFSCSVVLQK